MAIDDFLKKIQDLKDLRQAISAVRNSELEKANVVPMKPNTPIQQHDMGALQHLGFKKIIPGVVTHMIGTRGVNSPHHYEVDVNMTQPKHVFTINKVQSSDGSVIERDPTPHKNESSAVRSILSHHGGTGWQT